MGDYNKFNPNIPPPMPMNTPFGNNAQANQSVQQSSHHKPNQMRNPVGTSAFTNYYFYYHYYYQSTLGLARLLLISDITLVREFHR